MNITRKLGMLTATLALGVVPALAIAHPGGNSGSHKPSTPGANASAGAKAKAYGKFCQGESKTHVAGTPGTPFSKCVTDLAKVAHNKVNPTTACKNLSKKHVAGTKGTPYSICVSGAAKLLKTEKGGGTTTTTTTTTTTST
jgi:hypothetical protein